MTLLFVAIALVLLGGCLLVVTGALQDSYDPWDDPVEDEEYPSRGCVVLLIALAAGSVALYIFTR